jgi:hypothetical protein
MSWRSTAPAIANVGHSAVWSHAALHVLLQDEAFAHVDRAGGAAVAVVGAQQQLPLL